MNYRVRSSQASNNWRASNNNSVAHKLLSVELNWHQEKASLLREIKRLRSEVGLMARQRNFHKAQTNRLASILKNMPPPTIPTREGLPKVAEDPTPNEDEDTEERGRPRSRGSGRSGRNGRSSEAEGSEAEGSEAEGSEAEGSEAEGRKKREVERVQDTPITDQYNHTTGTTRNEDNAFPDRADTPTDPQQTSFHSTSHRGISRSGPRTPATTVVSELRRTRSRLSLSTDNEKKETKEEERIEEAKRARWKTKVERRKAMDKEKEIEEANKVEEAEKAEVAKKVEEAEKAEVAKRIERMEALKKRIEVAEERKKKKKAENQEKWREYTNRLENMMKVRKEDRDQEAVESLQKTMRAMFDKWDLVDGRVKLRWD